jgi:NAD(P)-dependent dehydrogenase (short-subunit alcohol dehydrogenase family)
MEIHASSFRLRANAPEGRTRFPVSISYQVTLLSPLFTYSMSKAAVRNLTGDLAHKWASLGIRVNTLVPGFFPAEQNKNVLTPDRVSKIMGHSPAGRFGEARESVGAALLLASGEAGSFITGRELGVDGGFPR